MCPATAHTVHKLSTRVVHSCHCGLLCTVWGVQVPGLLLVPKAPGADAQSSNSMAIQAEDMLCEAQAEVTGQGISHSITRTTLYTGKEVHSSHCHLCTMRVRALQVNAENRDAYATSLTLNDVLDNEQLLLRFKRVTYLKGLGEENPTFLTELRAISRTAASLNTPTASWAFALPRLRTLATVYLTKATSMKLEGHEETRRAAVASFAAAAKAGVAAGGSATALLACFDAVAAEVTAACTARLDDLRTAVSEAGPLRSVGKARRTVVVVGGGIAGSFAARWLDKHHHDKLDTILVDPKEYPARAHTQLLHTQCCTRAFST